MYSSSFPFGNETHGFTTVHGRRRGIALSKEATRCIRYVHLHLYLSHRYPYLSTSGGRLAPFTRIDRFLPRDQLRRPQPKISGVEQASEGNRSAEIKRIKGK